MENLTEIIDLDNISIVNQKVISTDIATDTTNKKYYCIELENQTLFFEINGKVFSTK